MDEPHEGVFMKLNRKVCHRKLPCMGQSRKGKTKDSEIMSAVSRIGGQVRELTERGTREPCCD